MFKRILLVILLFILEIGIFGINQEAKADTDYDGHINFDKSIQGKWNLKFQNSIETEKDYALTKEENSYCRKKMLQMTEIFKNNPVIKPMKGFNVLSNTRYTPPDDWYGQHNPPYKNLRIRMEFCAYLPELLRSKGKIVQSIEAPCFQVSFNDPFHLISAWQIQYGGLFDEKGRAIFLQPYSDHTAGNITFYGNKVILTKKDRPLWIPITQEQYLKALLYHYQQMEKENNGDPTLLLDFIKTELNALSPEERSQPAYYLSGSDDPTGLCGQDDEGAFALVTLNPNFFDKSLPRTSIQLIIIEFGYGSGFNGYEEADKMVFEKAGSNKTLYDLEKSLNYKAIEKLLD